MLFNVIVLCHFIGIFYYILGLIEIEMGIKGNWLEINNVLE